MTLQSRFHFLNLWNELPCQTEGTDEEKEGTERDHQSANKDISQWHNERLVSGKCGFFLFVCLSTYVGSEPWGLIISIWPKFWSDTLLSVLFLPHCIVPLNVFIPSKWCALGCHILLN